MILLSPPSGSLDEPEGELGFDLLRLPLCYWVLKLKCGLFLNLNGFTTCLVFSCSLIKVEFSESSSDQNLVYICDTLHLSKQVVDITLLVWKSKCFVLFSCIR